MSDLTTRILEAVSRPGYHAVKPKVLARRLDIVEDADYAEFRKALKALVADGRLEVVAGSSVRAADQSGSLVGLFRRTSSGLCFVRPHLPNAETGPEVRVRDGKSLDASAGLVGVRELIKRIPQGRDRGRNRIPRGRIEVSAVQRSLDGEREPAEVIRADQ